MYHGLRGSVGTLDHANPTRLSKRHQMSPYSRWKTYELVSRNYWWPGMTTFVKKYIMGCDMCQRMKNRPQQPFGPLVPNKVPNGPWEIISMDLITQLPESNGYNAICVIVDRLTKRAHFIPINNQFSSKNMAQLLYDCHKLHSAISPPILRRFPRSQSQLKALKEDLSIDTSHVSKQSIMVEILGRSTGNHHGTIH